MGSREIVPSQADRELRGRERWMDGWVKTRMEEAMEPNNVQIECDTNFRSFICLNLKAYVQVRIQIGVSCRFGREIVQM